MNEKQYYFHKDPAPFILRGFSSRFSRLHPLAVMAPGTAKRSYPSVTPAMPCITSWRLSERGRLPINSLRGSPWLRPSPVKSQRLFARELYYSFLNFFFLRAHKCFLEQWNLGQLSWNNLNEKWPANRKTGGATVEFSLEWTGNPSLELSYVFASSLPRTSPKDGCPSST